VWVQVPPPPSAFKLISKILLLSIDKLFVIVVKLFVVTFIQLRYIRANLLSTLALPFTKLLPELEKLKEDEDS
jgi:hypothetical protein